MHFRSSSILSITDRVKTGSMVSVRGHSRQIGLQVHAKKDDDTSEVQSSSRKTSLALNSTMLPCACFCLVPSVGLVKADVAVFFLLQ